VEDLWPDPTTGLVRLFALVAWVTGLVLALRMVRRGAVARRRWREMRRAALPGVATVVSLRETVHLEDSETGQQWKTSTPTLRYQTAAGQVVTVEGPALSGPGFLVGATVPIRYHPDKPSLVDITLPDTPVDDGRGALVGGAWAAAFAIALLVAVPVAIVAWGR